MYTWVDKKLSNFKLVTVEFDDGTLEDRYYKNYDIDDILESDSLTIEEKNQ
jgi:hypothetical protein